MITSVLAGVGFIVVGIVVVAVGLIVALMYSPIGRDIAARWLKKD